MTAALHDRLTAFVNSLAGRDMETLKDTFMNEVIETGGEYIPPPEGTPDSYFEISLHGVTAIGQSEERAINNWTLAATARLVNRDGAQVEDDGFITVHPPCGTPRNHADEITNAVADRHTALAGAFTLNLSRMPFGVR